MLFLSSVIVTLPFATGTGLGKLPGPLRTRNEAGKMTKVRIITKKLGLRPINNSFPN